MSPERYAHMYELGKEDAKLYPQWSMNSLIVGYGDWSNWTPEDTQAYQDGYEFVRGKRTAQKENFLDWLLHQKVSEYEEWQERQERKGKQS